MTQIHCPGRVECLVPGAAGFVLRFASSTFRNAMTFKLRIPDSAADTGLERAFQLMSNSHYPIRINTELLLQAPGRGKLRLAACPLRSPVSGKLGIPDEFADPLLDSPFDLVAKALELMFDHESVLSDCLFWFGRISES